MLHCDVIFSHKMHCFHRAKSMIKIGMRVCVTLHDCAFTIRCALSKYGFVIVYLCEVVNTQCNSIHVYCCLSVSLLNDSCCQQYQQDVLKFHDGCTETEFLRVRVCIRQKGKKTNMSQTTDCKTEEINAYIIILKKPTSDITHIMEAMEEVVGPAQMDHNLWRVFDELIYYRFKEFYDEEKTKVYQTWSLRFGEHHGTHREYYQDGSICCVKRHMDGMVEGITEYHDVDGNLTTIDYHKGKRHGCCLKKNKASGEIFEKSHWQEGKLHGLLERFEQGVCTTRKRFEDGMAHGVCETFHANGRLKRRCTYVNDEEDGEVFESDERGLWTSKTMFKHGLEDGIYEQFCNGTLITYGEYKEGVLHGTYLKCDIDGFDIYLQQACTYVEGAIHGEHFTYNPDGSVEEIRLFEHNVPVIPVIFDDEE